MVDLGGYVIILVETRDKKIKLYGICSEPVYFRVANRARCTSGAVFVFPFARDGQMALAVAGAARCRTSESSDY